VSAFLSDSNVVALPSEYSLLYGYVIRNRYSQYLHEL